jgi:hypothetical protein
VGTQSRQELLKPLHKEGLKVHVVGDAVKPASLFEAVKSGYEVGLTI